jgi:hypothetical protein
LTYGQSALVLISSGVASVPAAFFFGWLGFGQSVEETRGRTIDELCAGETGPDQSRRTVGRDGGAPEIRFVVHRIGKRINATNKISAEQRPPR